MVTIGIDVGGTTIKAGVFTEGGEVLSRTEFPADTTEHGAHILDNVATSLPALIKAAGVSGSDVSGVGIGVPGAVLSDGTVNRCINLGWGVFHVKTKLEALINLPVTVINDANAAALGEVWMGAAKGCDSAFLVTIGTGIGGGLVMNGAPVYGAFGGAGELGHICVNPTESVQCSCGKYGCLEQYCSANGTLRLARESFGDRFSSAKELYDAANAGDPDALSIVDQALDILGYGLSCVSSTADPEMFIIGGGVSRAGKILTDKISENFHKYCFHASKNARFVLAKLGNDAGIYGAARAAQSLI